MKWNLQTDFTFLIETQKDCPKKKEKEKTVY